MGNHGMNHGITRQQALEYMRKQFHDAVISHERIDTPEGVFHVYRVGFRGPDPSSCRITGIGTSWEEAIASHDAWHCCDRHRR